MSSSLATLELRVLEGRQGGARTPLEAGVPCVVAANPAGHAEDADVVLREDGVAPVKVRVTAGLPNALIEVIAGEVELGDQVLGAGAQAPWAVCAPLKIGGAVVAFGKASDADWGADEAEMRSAEGELVTADLPAKRRGRPELWLVAIGAVVVVSCLAFQVFFRTPAEPVAAVAEQPDIVRLTGALKTSDFAALDAEQDALGRITLRGRLATVAEKQALDAWLAANRFQPIVQIQVDEVVVRNVSETFRVNGVTVQARLESPGRVAVVATERDPGRLAKAEEAVRRDVRGFDSLAVENRATPAPPPAPPVIDDPNKRIASVVPGNPAYLVTVDGARYFVGATLPTGHRITRIAGTGVTVERDGQPQTLNF